MLHVIKIRNIKNLLQSLFVYILVKSELKRTYFDKIRHFSVKMAIFAKLLKIGLLTPVKKMSIQTFV